MLPELTTSKSVIVEQPVAAKDEDQSDEEEIIRPTLSVIPAITGLRSVASISYP